MGTARRGAQATTTAERGKRRARFEQGDGVMRATGRSREEWFALLDASGLAGSPYRDIAARLVEEHSLSKWWAQKLTVEYQQARRQRAPGVRPDGTFTVSASKTLAAPTERVFAAFADAKLRRRWLPDVGLRKRASEQGRSIRFDHEDGVSRLNVSVTALASQKTQVTVEHVRLTDADVAAAAKAHWRERLTLLKSTLES